MKHVNVLHVIDHMGIGGAQRIVGRLLSNWDGENIKLLCYALRVSTNTFDNDNKQIFFSSNYKSKYNVFSFFKLRDFVAAKNINILHLHLAKSIVFGILIKMFYFKGIKLIVHEHGEIYQNNFLYNYFLIAFQGKVDLFIAVSKATERMLIENAKINKNKIKILYNFIDLNDFKSFKIKNYDRIIERRRIGINKEDFVLGFAGRLSRVKGCDILIKSITYVKIPDCKVVIAGDGVGQKELEKLAENLNVSDIVIFLGYVKDMVKFYSLIDCLVIPSRSESFGLSAIEAQALGVPVIAANIQGLNEVVLDKKTGLLFKAEDTKDLAKKIELICTDENLRIELTKKGLEGIKKYSLKNYMTDLEGIYNGLL